jgi:predicted RNA binding protein YcfA (HicA-like mRNA interferase family)
VRDINTVVRVARARGWTVTCTRGGHLRFTHPNGALVHTSSTPGDRRAVAAIRAHLRRAEQVDDT